MASKALPSALCSHPGLRQTQREGLILPVLPDFIGHQRRQDGSFTDDDYAYILQPLRPPSQNTLCVASDVPLARKHVAVERRPLQAGMHKGSERLWICGCECSCTLLCRQENFFHLGGRHGLDIAGSHAILSAGSAARSRTSARAEGPPNLAFATDSHKHPAVPTSGRAVLPRILRCHSLDAFESVTTLCIRSSEQDRNAIAQLKPVPRSRRNAVEAFACRGIPAHAQHWPDGGYGAPPWSHSGPLCSQRSRSEDRPGAP